MTAPEASAGAGFELCSEWQEVTVGRAVGMLRVSWNRNQAAVVSSTEQDPAVKCRTSSCWEARVEAFGFVGGKSSPACPCRIWIILYLHYSPITLGIKKPWLLISLFYLHQVSNAVFPLGFIFSSNLTVPPPSALKLVVKSALKCCFTLAYI